MLARALSWVVGTVAVVVLEVYGWWERHTEVEDA